MRIFCFIHRKAKKDDCYVVAIKIFVYHLLITEVSFAYFSFQRKVGQLQYFLSRLRNCMASAMCGARMISLSARSATVRATRRILS